MPRLLYILTGVILMTVWLGIASQFVMTLQSAEAENQQGNVDDPAKLSGAFGTNSVMFFMAGSLNQFDPDSRNLSEYQFDFRILSMSGC